jgi:hypothetical protein
LGRADTEQASRRDGKIYPPAEVELRYQSFDARQRPPAHSISSGPAQPVDRIDRRFKPANRVGGRFDDVWSFLRYASEAKAELNSNVLLIAQCIQMKQRLPEFEQFRELVAFKGVDPVFKPIYIGGYGIDYLDFVSGGSRSRSPS